MRFKKLELLGFKSFAGHTEILFEPGVTAIVGPNGGGKSNLSDAIKWVLGEQSARELRGGRMEDLIFNGSDRREPISYAEVSLTLDNSDKALPIDYSEVIISRRLFRSGESEYLLNGTQVRLKEITELLMGTGIGTSAYSLFEQGRIEQIISARPEDRRIIFEEAAGITKYKAQKKETLRRMDEVEQNLSRVGDVTQEVKRQIQSMERQVRKAKSYQEQFERLKGMEVRLARSEESRLSSEWRSKETALSELRGQVAGLEQSLGSQEAVLQEARDRVAQQDAGLTQAREQYLSVTHNRETTRQRLELLKERIAEGESRRAQIGQELADAQEQIGRLRQQREELAALVAQADGDRQQKELQVSRQQQRLQECASVITEATERIARAQEELLDKTHGQIQVKNQQNRIHQELSRLEARMSRLSMEQSKVSSEKEQASSQVQDLEAALSRLKAAAEELDQEQHRHREILAADEKRGSEQQQQVAALEQELTRVGSQLELLKMLVVSHEGYSSGVKELLAALDQGLLPREGVIGVLAELIQVEPLDTAAVDAALGSWAEALVVESAEVAESCRIFLEERQAGRVLFLIRDRVPENGVRHQNNKTVSDTLRVSDTTGVPLIDRVGITPHLEPLLRFLLADTWLIPKRVRPLFLDKGQTPSARLVTPTGEWFTTASALLGSAPAEEGLVVGRKSRLQSLELSFGHLSSQTEEAKRHLALLEQEHGSHLQASLDLEAASKERSQELHRAEAALASAAASLEKLEKEEQLLKVEQAEVEEEWNQVRSRLKAGEQELAAKDQELAGLQESIQAWQGQIAQAASAREEASVVLATTRAELSAFDQVVNSRRDSLRVLEETLQGTESQVATDQEELDRLTECESQWRSSSQELEHALGRLADERSQAQARVDAAERLKQKEMEQALAQERQWMGVSRQLEHLQGKAHALEMEQQQLSFQRDQLRGRLQQVYQVNLEEASGEGEAVDLDTLKEDIEQLSARMQRMGPVNLSSIDEERELQNRYEYLVNQQNDLSKAKEDIHAAIARINRTTRSMFRETFEAIQREFAFTFQQLFGGGEARLVLLDEEDLLESGIEIIARPPGKPLQAISLLSGGEKALTTIALLFAIFRIKPSPFCLLDEIDAPLDESNIGRFTDALREFLKESQFIIITHNKKTITMADVMYGVTMEESGVSKIVSVKFKSNGNGHGNGNGAVTALSPTPPQPQPAP